MPATSTPVPARKPSRPANERCRCSLSSCGRSRHTNAVNATNITTSAAVSIIAVAVGIHQPNGFKRTSKSATSAATTNISAIRLFFIGYIKSFFYRCFKKFCDLKRQKHRGSVIPLLGGNDRLARHADFFGKLLLRHAYLCPKFVHQI